LAYRCLGLFRGAARDFQLAVAALAPTGAHLARRVLLPRDALRTVANRWTVRDADLAVWFPAGRWMAPVGEEVHLQVVSLQAHLESEAARLARKTGLELRWRAQSAGHSPARKELFGAPEEALKVPKPREQAQAGELRVR
jgi:hypothetical protein